MVLARISQPSPGAVVATIVLFSPKARISAPYTRGIVFPPCAVPRGLFVVVDDAYVTPLVTYPDGSLRLARVTGYATIAGSKASVAAKLAASPPAPRFFRTDAANVAVATDYGAASGRASVLSIGNDAHLRLRIERYWWPHGERESTLILENGFLKVPGCGERSGRVKVEIDGKLVFDRQVMLTARTRAKLGAFWTGCEDPEITPGVDATALEAFGLPHYGIAAIPVVQLAKLKQSFPPGSPGDGSPGMGEGGYQSRIGLLPDHAARAIVSNDPRAIRNTLANADSAMSWPVHYRDEITDRPLRFDQHPYLSITSSDHGDYPAKGSGAFPLVPDIAHQPQQVLLAYLLTARDYYLDEMLLWDAWNFIMNTDMARRGAEGLFRPDAGANQARGAAWGLRSRCQLLAVLPVAHPNFAAVRASVEANFAMYRGRWIDGNYNESGLIYTGFASGGAKNNLGAFVGFDTNNPGGPYANGDGTYRGEGWQNSFIVQTFGHAWDLALPIGAKAQDDLKTCRDFGYKFIVGLCGDGSPGSFDYRRFDVYGLPLGKVVNGKLAWFANFGEVHAAYIAGLPPLPGDKTIRNHDGNQAIEGWASGFAGNHLPALSYAVKHGAPHAAQAYARVTSSDSWKLARDFVDGPQFGILPPGQLVTSPLPLAAPVHAGAFPWVPPPGFFADLPTVNMAQDAVPPIFTKSDGEVLFDHWTGGAIIADYGSHGALAIAGAGHYTSNQSPDIQFAFILPFHDLTWRSSNAPLAVNTVDKVVAPGRYPDGSYTIPHTYNGLAEWPKDWGGGTMGSLLSFGFAGSGIKNFVVALDLAQRNDGYSRLTPGAVAFGNADTRDAGAYPAVVIDRKRQGWWYNKTAEADRLAFVGKDGRISYHPPLLGNNQAANLMRDEKRDFLFAMNGGPKQMWGRDSAAFNAVYVRDCKDDSTHRVKIVGELPINSLGNNDPDRCGFEYIEAMDAFVGRDCHTDPPSYLVMRLGADPKKDDIVSTRITLKHWDEGDPHGSAAMRASTNGDWGKHRHVPQLGPRVFIDATHANVRPQVVSL